ncbi:MAG: c-type cytochrome [Anaerolineae bacterium]|nr:c-type cytochrome [Anaerolineae bacterium]
MFKRTWMMVPLLSLAMVLGACGGGDLAKDLTPIPTLPKGEEPALVDALQATPAPAGEVAATETNTEEGGGEEADTAQLVAQGKELFVQCEACHGAADGAGPAFPGMGERAATRVEGTSAEDYLHEAIVEPSAYVVPGFGDIMPKNYGEQFSETELQALVAYILAESGGGAAPAEGATPETGTPATEEATPEVAAPAAGDPANGKTLFDQTCSGCHGAADGAGPALTGMGERAATRVAGLSAEDYLHQSIVDPSAYVVPGFGDIMPKNFGEQYDEAQLADIIAYILTQ